jgi:hypothetical protein
MAKQISVGLLYVNNRASQKAVQQALRESGVLEAHIKMIDWNKSQFPGSLVGVVNPCLGDLANWPKRPMRSGKVCR